MKRLLGLIFNRWLLIAVALLCVALVVWIIGPLVAIAELHPLQTERSRWITIGVIVALVGSWIGLNAWRARRGNAAVVNQLMAAPADKGPSESADLAAVRERFERALLTLKRARFGSGGLLSGWSAKFGGRYLYELPWYLIIGAPGSGKTTALQNSGLSFPLADKVGQYAVRGVGGTRNCDWWFTDQAVLIDTAGRFTTQDSDRENDRATWSGFLGLLKKARPRQPLNGVLVTVSITDLLTRDAADRAQHAATVRQRVQELQEGLGIRFPIYLLVTKCDLLAGFMDYFATLDKDQRATPWGYTFALDEKAEQGLERFGAEFDRLQQRLTDGLIDRLQVERDAQRRARIYAFPTQFGALRQVLQEFAETVFSPSRFEAEPMLRGMYLVSGTQEGTPIDRLLGSIARSYKLERAILAPNQASGKSYFLNRLLGEVVFAESGIAGTNLRWERRRTWAALAAYAVLALLTIGAIGAWSVSYLNNRRYVDEVASRVEAARKIVQATPNRPTADLRPVVTALDTVKALAKPGQDDKVPWSLGFGLYQGDKLDSAARHAYERMLVDAVQPRLALRVEEQLRAGGSATETLYEALKAYLMLHEPERFDDVALKRYFEGDWDARLARELGIEERARLSEHLDALLAQDAVASPLPLDKELVKHTRLVLGADPLPRRIYNRMRHYGLGSAFPEFTIESVAGAKAALAFTRASGAPLNKGVPGLFSYRGYHEGFQTEVGKVAGQLAAEQEWVMGAAPDSSASKDLVAALQGGTLSDGVRRIYLNEYVSVWDAFIADIRILPMTNIGQSVQVSRVLAAGDSPLPILLRAISRETTLLAPSSVLDKAKSGITGIITAPVERLGKSLGAKPSTAATPEPRIQSIVDDHFKGLRQLVTAPEGGKAPIEAVVGLIGEAYSMLSVAETALQGGGAPPPSQVPGKLKAEAASLPEPAKSLIQNLASASGSVAAIQLREILSREVRAQVGEFCQQAAAGRYPLDRNATREVTPADFAQLFGPSGKIETLVQQTLKPYVDTTTRPWRFRPLEGIPLGRDAGSLPQFQRAAAIRETFFPPGAAGLALRLEFKPVEMDASIKHFILDVDGQLVRYDHGPAIPTAVQWPGPRGSSQVRASIDPPSASGGASAMITEGPWALFRMFERVQLDRGSSPEKFRASFTIDGRKAVFDISTSSVRNPFRLEELADFQCPQGL